MFELPLCTVSGTMAAALQGCAFTYTLVCLLAHPPAWWPACPTRSVGNKQHRTAWVTTHEVHKTGVLALVFEPLWHSPSVGSLQVLLITVHCPSSLHVADAVPTYPSVQLPAHVSPA